MSLIANDGVDVVGDLSENDQFDYAKFERYYAALEDANDETIDD